MSDNRIIECMERAQYLLGNLMAVKPGEEVLIVVDPQTDESGRAPGSVQRNRRWIHEYS